MDRLTYFEHGKNRLLFEGTEYSNACVDRLAAYEDTGLTPEEIEELKAIKWWSQCGTDDMLPTIFGVPINRLRALAEADRDGRVVVLGEYPAKNRYDAADYLSDWVKEAEYEDLKGT